MSTWTDIYGILSNEKILITENDIGRQFNIFEDDASELMQIENLLPSGSEGSFNYIISDYNRVKFYGSMRDYDDIEELKLWFDELAQRLNLKGVINIKIGNSLEVYKKIEFKY